MTLPTQNLRDDELLEVTPGWKSPVVIFSCLGMLASLTGAVWALVYVVSHNRLEFIVPILTGLGGSLGNLGSMLARRTGIKYVKQAMYKIQNPEADTKAQEQAHP